MDIENKDQQESQTQQTTGQETKNVSSASDAAKAPEHKKRDNTPNPLRSLGDTLEYWKRKLEVVEDEEETGNEENVADNEETNEAPPDDSLYQYTHDENEKHDNQTLGIASEEQAKEMNMDIDELKDDDEIEKEAKEEEENQEKGEEEIELGQEKSSVQSSIPSKDMSLQVEENEEQVLGNEEQELNEEEKTMEVEKPEELEPINDIEEEIEKVSLGMHEKLNITEPINEELLTHQDIVRMRQDLDIMMNKWKEDPNNVQMGAQIWRHLQNITGSSAQQLCEQLRLILEPTQKAKLKGDYRTGKRLNMRRVVTYVASQYRKDKIWLRRTQPNKRTYQIMIALDDSESIELVQASHLVREATSTICIALQRLEVGQISLLKFGDSVSLLHPFSEPFTDDAASLIMPQLTFKQKSTNIEEFLRKSIQIMELSRMDSQNNDDTMQIMFVIGDGRFGDKKNQLLKWLRMAQEKNIFIVFLIIDSAEKDQSILDIQSISYPQGKLTITPYIDGFPFSYYMILKKLDNLPHVLADALRQWFEMLQR